MLFQTIQRAVNIIKFDKNVYNEIIKDNSSLYGSGLIIIFSAIVNVSLFKIYLLPNLPNQVPLQYIFLMWIFFNWIVFSLVLLSIVKVIGGEENLDNKKIALSFIGFSNTAEILKLFIIFLPNFIVLISWSVLMLVIASQVVGVKQIFKVKSTSTAVGVVIGSYIAQFFLIGIIVFILIKLAY